MPESSKQTAGVTDLTGVGAVILAAGASTRMSIPKQLLQFRGQTFLTRAASVALEAGCRPVVVATGNPYKELVADLMKRGVQIELCGATATVHKWGNADKREKRGCTAASGQLHHRVNRPDGKRRLVIRVYNFRFARNHKASRAVIHFPSM